ncbi:MAG TPA: hypothetical protein VFC46_05385, partial [Humisphaera sp.]|nr:hypothetical protein [Humisphaera sp.]
MKRVGLIAFVLMIGAALASMAIGQIPPAMEATARELVEIMLREGGRDAATELAEMGGVVAVRQILDRATNEGGEELVERIAQYGTRYGPSALKAVEQSPSQMIRALDRIPPDLVVPAIRAAAREPGVTARLVAAYGKDALEVAAKHPGVGASLVEKLGADGITIGQKLTTDQVVTFARYADDFAALPAGDRNRVLDAIMKAPAAVLSFLETHPRVLLTAGGVAAVIVAKDNLLGVSPSSPAHNSTSSGLIERVISGLENKFVDPVKTVFAIIDCGVICYLAIQLRSLWKLKAQRLERKAK